MRLSSSNLVLVMVKAPSTTTSPGCSYSWPVKRSTYCTPVARFALASFQHRIQQHLGRCLGLGFADEAFAMAAVLALAEFLAVRIGVRARGIGGRRREGFVAELFRGRLEHKA